MWYDVTATPDQADTVREFYGTLLGWTIGPDTNPGGALVVLWVPIPDNT